MQYGDHIEVLKPASVRETIRDTAMRIAKNHAIPKTPHTYD
jgi:predicted DNA-binding transcriptional regulator YafY